MVGTPTQAEPLPSAVRPTRFTAAVGCACERRSPVELPRYSVATSMLGEAGQHGVAGAGPPEGARRATESTPLERAGVGLLGVRARSRGRAPASAGVDEGEGVLGRRRRPGVGQRRGHHLGHPVGADDAGAAGRADRRRRRRRRR